MKARLTPQETRNLIHEAEPGTILTIAKDYGYHVYRKKDTDNLWVHCQKGYELDVILRTEGFIVGTVQASEHLRVPWSLS